MPMNPHPTAYGVFKPVDHVVLSFENAISAKHAAQALRDEGFPEADVIPYTPEEMRLQAERDLQTAGAMASLGQELNLVKSHLALAQQSYSFLVVKASKQEPIDRVTQIAIRFNAARAQRYGSLVVEELVLTGETSHQVAESPDRGLDAQTHSGVEGDRVTS
jgi:hypothetical protein